MISIYEQLLDEAFKENIDVTERYMRKNIKGLYGDDVIWINKMIKTEVERGCVLAEELGHYHTSYGDILDQRSLLNRKQEIRARFWAYKRLVPKESFIQAYKSGIRNRYELAQYLNVTESFLQHSIDHYIKKYGDYIDMGNYTLTLNPLGVIEIFE